MSLAEGFSYIGFRTPEGERLDPNVGRSGNGPVIGRLPADQFGHWWNGVGRGTSHYLPTGELIGSAEPPLESPEASEKVCGLGPGGL